MLLSYLRLVLFAVGLLVGVQVPGFISDYAKRVEAHREMAVVSNVFDERGRRGHLAQQRGIGGGGCRSGQRLREPKKLPPRLIHAFGILPKALVHFRDVGVVECARYGGHAA